MARVINPARSSLASLRTPLTCGEALVLDFFDQTLPSGWEIYIQPHLNGLRPDFVLLNPDVGIAIYEVKDWRYSDSENTREQRRKGSPLKKAEQYKQAVLDLYCPRLRMRAGDNPQVAAAVTSGVILTHMTTDDAVELLGSTRSRHGHGRANCYYPLAGGDAIDSGDLDVVFPDARRRASRFMTPEIARDLRSWLIEPDYAITQRHPLTLDKRQEQLVTSTTETQSGYRRIKGPAGSGKSLTLAARAAWLSARSKEVLVVPFNMTLLHYLRDLAVRYPEPGRSIVNRITWSHFHDWCKRVVCLEADMENEYDAMWADYFKRCRQAPRNPENLLADRQDVPAELARVLEVELPALVSSAIEQARELGTLRTYDAILVDEGQDYVASWWDVLQRVLRPGGETWLVADDTQDIYGRSTRWTDERMRGAGFRGRWTRLESSYRLPAALVPHLERFVARFLDPSTSDPPVAKQLALDALEPVKVQWWQLGKEDDAVDACVEAVCEMPCFADPISVSFTDVTLLVGDNCTGLESVARLGARGIKTAHTFGEDYWKRKARKTGFYMGDGRVKATTIHSFKGWEARAIVVHIPRGNDEQARKAAYTALTRLKGHPEGSFMTVICTAPELESFGRTMPGFDDRKGQYQRRLAPASTAIRGQVPFLSPHRRVSSGLRLG